MHIDILISRNGSGRRIISWNEKVAAALCVSEYVLRLSPIKTRVSILKTAYGDA